jgi:hypothetical protein
MNIVLLTDVFINLLEIGNKFTINKTEYEVVKGRKNSKYKHWKPLFGLKNSKKTIYLYTGHSCIITPDNNENAYYNLIRDIEWLFIVDLLNINNKFHDRLILTDKILEYAERIS